MVGLEKRVYSIGPWDSTEAEGEDHKSDKSLFIKAAESKIQKGPIFKILKIASFCIAHCSHHF